MAELGIRQVITEKELRSHFQAAKEKGHDFMCLIRYSSNDLPGMVDSLQTTLSFLSQDQDSIDEMLSKYADLNMFHLGTPIPFSVDSLYNLKKPFDEAKEEKHWLEALPQTVHTRIKAMLEYYDYQSRGPINRLLYRITNNKPRDWRPQASAPTQTH